MVFAVYSPIPKECGSAQPQEDHPFSFSCLRPCPISAQSNHAVRALHHRQRIRRDIRGNGEYVGNKERVSGRLGGIGVIAPARSVDDDTAEAARDDTSDGEGDDPTHVDPGDHAPVDGPPGTRAETDTDGSTSDALSCGDGKLC